MAAGTTAGFAQDACADADGQAAVYTKFTDLYPKRSIPDRKAAIEAGKQFLEKYGSCESVAEQAKYIKENIPAMEKRLKDAEIAAERSAILSRFDAAIPAKNWDEAYAAGNEFISKFPNDDAQINIIIPLGLAGLIESYNKNYKYNDDSLKYAKLVISKLNGGAKCVKNKDGKIVPVCGAFQFEGTKEDVLSDMNYAIAFITYNVKKDQKGALPYYYEVAKNAGRNQKEPRVYGSIGSYYIEQRKPIGDEISKLIALQTNNKSDTDEVKLAREAEIKTKIALFNGYSERALDAFGRAYTVASENPANKAYKDDLYKIVQGLYEQRFDKKDGLDTFISSAVAKPLPNPTSEVTPVSDPEPEKTTTSTTDPVVAKPVVVPTKPVSATIADTTVIPKPVVKVPSETVTAKVKVPVKKPVVRKKRI